MNRFDKILWRIIGVLFLCLLLYFAWTVSEMSSHRRMEPARDKPSGPETSPQAIGETAPLKLKNPSRVENTPFLRISLETEVEHGKFSSYKGPPRAVYNYLYVNASDLSSWWLFDRSDKLITGLHDLRAEIEGPRKPVIATVWEVVPGDTDGDGRLTEADREAIYFCGADGKKPVEIIPPCDGLQSVQQTTPGQVLIIYRQEEKLIGALFSTADGAKIKESVLSGKTSD